jgi:hypothetical protein
VAAARRCAGPLSGVQWRAARSAAEVIAVFRIGQAAV